MKAINSTNTIVIVDYNHSLLLDNKSKGTKHEIISERYYGIITSTFLWKF